MAPARSRFLNGPQPVGAVQSERALAWMRQTRYRPGGSRTAALALYRIAGLPGTREREEAAAAERENPFWAVAHEWRTREGLRALTLQPQAEAGDVRGWAEALGAEWGLDCFVQDGGWWGPGCCLVEFLEKG